MAEAPSTLSQSVEPLVLVRPLANDTDDDDDDDDDDDECGGSLVDSLTRRDVDGSLRSNGQRTRPLSFTSITTALLERKQDTSRLLALLADRFPIEPNGPLGHLKRVRRVPADSSEVGSSDSKSTPSVEVLLERTTVVDSELGRALWKTVVRELSGEVTEVVRRVPSIPPRSVRRAKEWTELFWPVTFRPKRGHSSSGRHDSQHPDTNQSNDKEMLGDYVCEGVRQLAEYASQVGSTRVAGIIDPASGLPRVIAFGVDQTTWSCGNVELPGNDAREETKLPQGRPTAHAIMNAIQTAAVRLRDEPDEDSSKDRYMFTGLDCFVVFEPCVM